MKHNRLKLLRTINKVSVTSIAQALNCSRSLIYQLERGDIDFNEETLLRFSKYYGVSADYILGITDNPKPQTPSIGAIDSNKDRSIAFITQSLAKLDDRDLDTIVTLVKQFAEK